MWLAAGSPRRRSNAAGTCRVGLEPFTGERQPTNLELVEEAVALAERAGRTVATADEAATILGIKR